MRSALHSHGVASVMTKQRPDPNQVSAQTADAPQMRRRWVTPRVIVSQAARAGAAGSVSAPSVGDAKLGGNPTEFFS